MRVHGGHFLLALVMASTGCAGGDVVSVEAVLVEINDFSIVTAPSTPMSTRTLLLRNGGPSVHEVVVVRDDRGLDELPRTKDGQRLDEDAVEIVAADEFIADGAVDALSVSLQPGRYWLVCNIEGHYLGGMTAELRVTP